MSVQPQSPVPSLIPEEILRTSESFARIFIQASAAEAHGLSEVAGPAYRKALEFLVKDYCIAQEPGKREEIEWAKLSQCIREHVKDQRIESCASRAAWLGNDETHYLRKWADKDLEDLKTLIKLTVNWVQNQVLTAKYVADMPEKQ